MEEPTETSRMMVQLGRLLGRTVEGFDPAGSWESLGWLVERMEERGYFLMLNSTAAPKLKRIAAFHQVTERGFPCAGSSEWGPFATIGEAVVAAAHEALFRPRGA